MQKLVHSRQETTLDLGLRQIIEKKPRGDYLFTYNADRSLDRVSLSPRIKRGASLRATARREANTVRKRINRASQRETRSRRQCAKPGGNRHPRDTDTIRPDGLMDRSVK